MARGGPRPNAGRPKGVSNAKTEEIKRKAAEGGIMPLDYLLSIMRNEAMPLDERKDAAKAAAPYVHAKLAAVELSGKLGISHEDAIADLE